jgi:hypothetical protein
MPIVDHSFIRDGKVYVGIIDASNYLVVVSTESDEMFSLLLRGLGVIPKEQAQLARLERIKRSMEAGK